MSRIKKILAVLAAILLLSIIGANAQKGQGDLTGMGMEIDKPLIETISGTLDHIKTGPCENTTGRAIIGTHLFLKSDESNQLLNIHLGAAYATESMIEKLNVGQYVGLKGFRTDKMDEGHYVAKEITIDGLTFVLRDEELRPFWAGDIRPRRNARPDRRRRGWW